MKITRLNIGLLLTSVLAGFWVWLTAPEALESRSSETVFEVFDAAGILSVKITDRRDPDQTVELVRETPDGEWTVASRDGFPAETYPLEQLFACVGNLKQTDLVAESETGLQMFGLGQAAGFGVELSSPGAAPWKFVFAPPPGRGTDGFLCLDGESQVYKAAGFAGLGTQPREWITPRLFDFDESAVAGIALAMPDQDPLLLIRDEKGIWRGGEDDRVAPRVTLEDLIGDLTGLVLHDVESDSEGLEWPSMKVVLLDADQKALATLNMEMATGARRRLSSGAWAAAGHGDWIGLVDKALCEGVLARIKTIRSAFLAQPE